MFLPGATHGEGGCKVICPSYFKSIKLINNSSERFVVAVTTESGKSFENHVQPGENKLFAEHTKSDNY
jgi:hypothetical protein